MVEAMFSSYLLQYSIVCQIIWKSLVKSEKIFNFPIFFPIAVFEAITGWGPQHKFVKYVKKCCIK
jgi:hypothetical protein